MTITDSGRAKVVSKPQPLAPARSDSRAAIEAALAVPSALREPNSRPTSRLPMPEGYASDGPNSRAAIELAESRQAALRESNSHATVDRTPPGSPALRGPISRPAVSRAMPGFPPPDGAQLAARQSDSDALPRGAGGDQQGRDRAANCDAAPNTESLLDPALSLAADFLDDIERVKIANENRLRALLGGTKETEQEARYAGLTEGHPVVAKYAEMVDALGRIEHDAVLTLQRLMRKHPLGAWVKAQRGIGEKQAARLLASIGDPYWRPEIVREDGSVLPAGPRTVSALWAYSGLHVLPATDLAPGDTRTRGVGGGDNSAGGDSSHSPREFHSGIAGVAARRRKGEQANWSTKAKTRAYLIAESCLKQLKAPCHAGDFEGRWLAVHYDECVCSPYRLVYDRRKMHTSSSRPEWTDGHRHADALRVASKAILRDLWRASRDWHLKQEASS